MSMCLPCCVCCSKEEMINYGLTLIVLPCPCIMCMSCQAPSSFTGVKRTQPSALLLSLVTNIVQVHKEQNASRDLWLDIFRFPSVLAPSAKQRSVSPQDWQTHVANPNVRVRVLERFDQWRFTSMRQCSVPGAHVFIVA